MKRSLGCGEPALIPDVRWAGYGVAGHVLRRRARAPVPPQLQQVALASSGAEWRRDNGGLIVLTAAFLLAAVLLFLALMVQSLHS